MCDADPRIVDQRRANALDRCGHPHRVRLHVRRSRLRRRARGDAAGQERRRLCRGRRDIRRRGDRGQEPPRDVPADPDPHRHAPRRSRRTCSAPESCRPHCWAASWSGPASARSPPRRDSPPEPRYTPVTGVAEFVRCRDLTCRFPGCDEPAQVCDLDHTVAYPVGPTHPSNLKCLCRFHHLLKTFWNGLGGWRDRQLPDGTIMWTSPTGHTYITYPGSLHLFPKLCAAHRHPVDRRTTHCRTHRRPRRDDAHAPTHPR